MPTEYEPTVFEESLIKLTSPEPWDQIIVLSRETINRDFASLFEAAKKKNPMSEPLCHIEFTTRGDANIAANVDASTVIVNVVKDGDVQPGGKKPNEKYVPMVIFQWNLRDGLIRLPINDNPDDMTTKDFVVDGWKVAFETSVGEY
jgi:hypothetical protein